MMEKKRTNKNLSFFLLSALLIILLTTITDKAAGDLSQQSLKNDLNYYHRVSKEKNLNSNDRYYILSSLEQKYKNSNIDISALKQEIIKLNQSSAGEKNKIKASNNEELGSVEKIIVSNAAAESKITVTAKGVERYNYFLLKDNQSGAMPKIVLDLYGVKEKLSKAAKNIVLKKGVFSNIRAAQFEDEPDNIVRIAAQMRFEAPYTIKYADDKWMIIAVSTPGAEIANLPSTVKSQAAEELPPNIKDDTYKIDSGDILGMTVYPADELSREIIVQIDGTVMLPLVGTFTAKGLTQKQFEKQLTDKYSRFISNPQITIVIKQLGRKQIFVTGEVRSVGAYNYKNNLRLLEFISSAGGFSEQADRKEVKIYRGPPTKRQIHIINVEEIIRSGDFTKDFLLEPGDIIEVSKGHSRIAILGDVRNPGYYDYRDGLHLIELISLAGGFIETAQIKKIKLLHYSDPGQKKTVSIVNFDRILSGEISDIPVNSGDTVYIPKKSIATANWFLNNIMPWLSLLSLIIVLRAGA